MCKSSTAKYVLQVVAFTVSFMSAYRCLEEKSGDYCIRLHLSGV